MAAVKNERNTKIKEIIRKLIKIKKNRQIKQNKHEKLENTKTQKI